MMRTLLPLILSVALAGCGTVAAPVWQATATVSSEVTESAPAMAEPTRPPTNTPLPPTATATLPPTATPTPPPTATAEPTAEPALSPIERLVAVRDPEKGEVLFHTVQAAASNYACSTCHSPVSEKTLIGPGLLNIKDRAATRIEGQSAAEYLYNSIIDTKAFIVDDYDENLMPENWPDIYSRIEIFDIVAYLMTLEGESDLDAEDDA